MWLVGCDDYEPVISGMCIKIETKLFSFPGILLLKKKKQNFF